MKTHATVLLLAVFLSACGGAGTIVATTPALDGATTGETPQIVGSGSHAPDAAEPDVGAPATPEDTFAPPLDQGSSDDPDTTPLTPDPGEATPDVPAPPPDEGSPPDIPAPEPDTEPPTCDCGPDQTCVDGTCVPTCQGGCECAPGPSDCPNPPGGGLVPNATTPDAFATLKALTAMSAHWGACTGGDELACHLFTREAARHLFEKNPNWGLLSKVPGQSQCTATACGNDVTCGYAGDAIIYRATDQVVDMIAGVGLPGASVAWQLVPKLSYNNWVEPPCDAPPPPKDKLLSGESLSSGGKRVSADGRFQLEYQTDGDLVLTYLNAGVLWSSGTKSAPGNAQMQQDGNLVIYDAVGTPQWSSGTSGNAGAYLAIQTDGNALIFSKDGAPLWATDTCCK